MKTALVVGGTGPTGPFIVNGLLERGYDVSIFHGGFHEVDFAGEVTHIHGDPHFPETIRESLGRETFDVVIAQYGRLRHLVEHFRNRTGHMVAIGAASGLLARRDAPEWGILGRPEVLEEELHILETDKDENKFGFRMAEAARELLEAHEAGHFRATYLGYPILYGPRQPGSREWSIVRRVLDGRKKIILADGGIKLESRGYVENVANAPLLAIDSPEVSAGNSYVVADLEVHSMRQRVQAIAALMDHQFDIVDMPFDIAKPCYPLYRNNRNHRVVTSRNIRRDLRYRDEVSAEVGLRRTVEWLVAHRPESGGETEKQLGDPFAYEDEDRLIADWEDWNSRRPAFEFDVPEYAHIYRHPKRPNEAWQRPEKPARVD